LCNIVFIFVYNFKYQTMAYKRKKLFVIPAVFEIAPGEYGKFEDFPNAKVFGDAVLAEILGVARITIFRWRSKGIIPFQQKINYTEFNLLDVVNSLKMAGYSQDEIDNPTAHSR
jgi:hypothetical protein